MSPAVDAARVRADIARIRRGEWRGDVHPAYAGFLRGKRVALVGPARTLLGRARGPAIDDHEVVVRVNDVFDLMPFPADLAADIGARTDVLYCNQVILERRLLDRRGKLDRSLTNGLRFVVCTNNSLALTRDVPDPRLRVVRAAAETLSAWLNGNWARTGLVTIFDLLTFDVARLFVTGMTFFHGGGHLLAPPEAELHPQKNRDGSWARDASGRGHDSFLELEVMRLLVDECRGVLDTDDELADLLARVS